MVKLQDFLNRLILIGERITLLSKELEEVCTSSGLYYSKVASNEDRIRDCVEVKSELNDLYNEYAAIIDSMNLELNLKKLKVNDLTSALTLIGA